MTGRRWRAEGQVQGVGFRWWTRSVAQDLGLTGSVRNRRDGSVEIEAFGETDTLDRFAGLLRNGPPGASVRRLTVESLAAMQDTPPTSFTILPTAD